MSDIDDGVAPGIVAEALAPESFSFAEVVQGRGYPKDTVTLYTDEQTAYDISKIDERLAEIKAEQKKILDVEVTAGYQDEVAQLQAKRAEMYATLAKSGMVFHLQGISDELRDSLLESAREKVKVEYDRDKNFLTGQVEKREKDSPERDRLYTNMLWAAHITQIVAPDGRVDTAPGLAAAEAVRQMPRAQVVKFAQAVQKLQVASGAFEAQASDPDFS